MGCSQYRTLTITDSLGTDLQLFLFVIVLL